MKISSKFFSWFGVENNKILIIIHTRCGCSLLKKIFDKKNYFLLTGDFHFINLADPRWWRWYGVTKTREVLT